MWKAPASMPAGCCCGKSACAAGTRSVADDLFLALPSLREIYASPESVNLDLARLLLLLSAHALSGKTPSTETRWLIKGIAFAQFGRRIRIWRRNHSADAQDQWEDFLLRLRQ